MSAAGAQPRSEMFKVRRPLSLVFGLWGWVAFAGAFPLVLRLVYEQTVMTWDLGLQTVGWTLIHTYGGFFLLGILAVVVIHAWLLVFVAVWIRRRLTHKAFLTFGGWAQFVVLCSAAALFHIPYDFWQFATLEVSGPGQNVGGQLTAAASQNQKHLVKAFLRNGVPIDAPGQYGRTALDQACASGQVEMARYLISKRAQLDLAPDCRKVAEFVAMMKPLALSVEEDTGRPHTPKTTVEVTAPAPEGDYNRPKSKP
jgi:Ankyrin repeats (3 copies)